MKQSEYYSFPHTAGEAIAQMLAKSHTMWGPQFPFSPTSVPAMALRSTHQLLYFTQQDPRCEKMFPTLGVLIGPSVRSRETISNPDFLEQISHKSRIIWQIWSGTDCSVQILMQIREMSALKEKKKRVFTREKILCRFVAFVHKIMRPNISPLGWSQISSERLIQLVDHDSLHYLKQCCGKRHTEKLTRWCLSCHAAGSWTNAACVFSHQQGEGRKTWS